MAKYVGVSCPVCNQAFAQNDDVVVCPECGAPHHRECYRQAGACAFEQEHSNGKVWANPQEKVSSDKRPMEPVRCDRCNAINPPDFPYCQICGTQINHQAPRQRQEPPQPSQAPALELDFGGAAGHTPTMIYGKCSPQDSIEGETVRDLAFYIGPNSASYLEQFKKISETGRSVFLNIPAMIFGFYYYFYRKMYAVGSALFALFFISLTPYFLFAYQYTPYMMHQMGIGPAVSLDMDALNHLGGLVRLSAAIMVCISVVVSLFATRLYYRKALADINGIRQSGAEMDEQQYVARLSKKGGVSIRAIVLSVLLLVLLYFGVSMVVAAAVVL